MQKRMQQGKLKEAEAKTESAKAQILEAQAKAEAAEKRMAELQEQLKEFLESKPSANKETPNVEDCTMAGNEVDGNHNS